MRLRDLVKPLGEVTARGDLDREITGLTDDSRRVSPGGLFVAVKGAQTDGHRYLNQALSAGAGALVVEAGCVPAGTLDALGVPVVEVRDSRHALGVLASRFQGDPSHRLKMIGVTGTNGKTTTTYLCKSVLEAAGAKVGLVGTVAYLIGNERIDATRTTPGAVELQGLFRRMVDAASDAAVMEVSSHALALDRTAGCEFGTAVFTNLTQDHLDFHADMEDYFHAKLRLFAGLGSDSRAVVNLDDAYGARVSEATRARVWSYAIDRPADLRAGDVRVSLDGVRFTAQTPAGAMALRSPLVGRHNVYNILAAVGVGLEQGIALPTIAEGVANLSNVPGRFERVEAGQPFTVVVDYAHTEDALFRLLTTAEAVKTGRIITVFGCGGDRDRGKRPKMGRVGAVYSDIVVVTSDNPRTEDPEAIIREVIPGVQAGLREAGRGRYVVHVDRRAAIEEAVRTAQPGDLVLIAGKGHENYQIIGKDKHPFDDRVVAREAIEALTR
ncbi:MAG: UDP-N-acetylmuramoyl-L-alanyl-D-glutamate--2,6-diaminopimelate ligase [Nitrospirae bacterium]|nr:MAG: UDP-N-acetylmuramoyl-L-alanyl-D-glutamate--2,6-diaminopimelate ligase [Nitrospirota bacterium]